MKKGVAYYSALFNQLNDAFNNDKSKLINELNLSKQKLNLISVEIEELKMKFIR